MGGALSRQKRRAGNQSASKEAQAIYHKMTEVLENIALLVETQPLTDTILLMVGADIILCVTIISCITSFDVTVLSVSVIIA